MRRIFGGLIALLMLVTACGGGDDDTTTGAPGGSATPTATERPSQTTTTAEAFTEEEIAELAFLATVRMNAPAFDGIDDQILIDLAMNACDAFDAGGTLEQVLLAALSGSGDNPVFLEGVGQTIGAGVATYCPEYNSRIG